MNGVDVETSRPAAAQKRENPAADNRTNDAEQDVDDGSLARGADDPADDPPEHYPSRIHTIIDIGGTPKTSRLGPSHPSMKWPNDARGCTRSPTILAIASMGTARIAPRMPYIQYQNTSARMTSTGLIVNRLASSIGVMVSPSTT